jgi:anti-sigma B factor antagonist
MNLATDIDGAVAVLRPEGRLNMTAAPQLRTAVDEVVGDGASRVVVDLSACTFVDSSGLGALVGGLKAARQAGGDLRIAQAPEQVRTVLALTNLDRVLTPHATVEDARHGW